MLPGMKVTQGSINSGIKGEGRIHEKSMNPRQIRIKARGKQFHSVSVEHKKKKKRLFRRFTEKANKTDIIEQLRTREQVLKFISLNLMGEILSYVVCLPL